MLFASHFSVLLSDAFPALLHIGGSSTFQVPLHSGIWRVWPIGGISERLEIRRKGEEKIFLFSALSNGSVSPLSLLWLQFPLSCPLCFHLALGLGFETSVALISPFLLLVVVATNFLTSGLVTILYLPSQSFCYQCNTFPVLKSSVGNV